MQDDRQFANPDVGNDGWRLWPDSYPRSGSVSLTRNHYEKHVLKSKSNPMSPIYMIAFYMFMYGGVS